MQRLNGRRRGFLKELSQLAANRPPHRLAIRLEQGTVSETAYDFDPVPIRIVFVMREEFASQLSRLRPLFPTLRRSELRLEPFSTAQARDVLMRGALQGSLMSDEALDAIVAHLASHRGLASEILPAKLSALAQALAQTRKERGLRQVTPDLLPKPDRTTSAKPAILPTTNADAKTLDLQAKLSLSETRRRKSQTFAIVSLAAAVIAVSAPLVLDQFGPKMPS
jgi:hypothetical protein